MASPQEPPVDPFKPVLLALPSLAPSLAVEVLPYGLAVHRLFVQADGRTHDLIVGPEAPSDHLKKKYNHTIIGRYTNRLPVGTWDIERNGIKGKVTPVANERPTVSLHGGTSGYESVAWQPLAPASATLFTQAELATIGATLPISSLWKHVSKDGDMGFEGTLLLEVLIGLLSPSEQPTASPELKMGSVVIVYRAKLLEENKVTPINLTQHWGFNLTASLPHLPGALSVRGHKITMTADNTAEVDSSLLATGNLTPVGGTSHDHRSGRVLGDGWPEAGLTGKGGYDDFYSFPPTPPVAPLRVSAASLTPSTDLIKPIVGESINEEAKVVDLSSETSGLGLVFSTNQSGVQFYTNNFADGSGSKKKIHGGSGVWTDAEGYGPGSAAFLEFHEPLAAFLNPGLVRNGNDTLLASGEVYNNFVRVDVVYKSKSGDAASGASQE
ncbi:hypothetical protein JAAARDRAFT_39962 [Jaapia argillacea MUCL 33604]|uniref:Galactose mutarotase-like protein n=1 Tax=Jaapia argillacea MUCL 33604 TaxID=933084 RepID=A0A067PFR2_9AGAM|nr:hypothetical protein JAAARDRAFT_39962 [Jaapia argillacea MUCL 33604]